jgi:hypothetical protein
MSVKSLADAFTSSMCPDSFPLRQTIFPYAQEYDPLTSDPTLMKSKETFCCALHLPARVWNAIQDATDVPDHCPAISVDIGAAAVSGCVAVPHDCTTVTTTSITIRYTICERRRRIIIASLVRVGRH